MKRSYLLFLITTLLFINEGCKKSTGVDFAHHQFLIEEAKNYFSTRVLGTASNPQTSSGSDTGQNNRNPGETLLKNALWDQAQTIHLSAGEAVVVPVHYRKPFLVKMSFGGSKLYSIDDLSKLLIYQDVNKKYHSEVVTFFPDSIYSNLAHKSFSGIAVVEDWSGNSLNRYKYANGSIQKYNPILAAQRIAASNLGIIQVCYEISGFNYSVDDPDGYHWTKSYGCSTYYFNDVQVSTTEMGGVDYGRVSDIGGGGGGASSGYGISVANAVTVLPGNNAIANFKDYSKCFDNAPGSDHSYQVSVCVSQPTPGSRETWSFGGTGSSKGSDFVSVGHTFLTLSETAPSKTIIRNVGFYPSGSVTPNDPTSPGMLNNDEMHDYNVSLTINLTSSQFTLLMKYIAEAGSAGYTYNLNSFNCTSFALNALGSIGVNLPRTTGEWLNGSGNNPADLGEDIRQMQLSSNMSRSTAEKAHVNKGTCN